MDFSELPTKVPFLCACVFVKFGQMASERVHNYVKKGRDFIFCNFFFIHVTSGWMQSVMFIWPVSFLACFLIKFFHTCHSYRH